MPKEMEPLRMESVYLKIAFLQAKTLTGWFTSNVDAIKMTVQVQWSLRCEILETMNFSERMP